MGRHNIFLLVRTPHLIQNKLCNNFSAKPCAEHMSQTNQAMNHMSNMQHQNKELSKL